MPFEFLQKSRKKQVPGNIFAMEVAGLGFMFGRVILSDAKPFENSKGMNLIYVFKDVLQECKPDLSLKPSNLLIDPLITNDQMWLQGFAKTIENRAIADDERYKDHYFKDFSAVRDAFGNAVDSHSENVFDGGLWSYQEIEDLIDEKFKLNST